MKLALGTAQFGMPYGVANRSGRIATDEARRIIAAACEAGVDLLDTAIAYGDSQTVLGRIGMSGWKVVSKLPGLPQGCDDVRAWAEGLVRESLQQLGVERLYGLLLHRSSDLLGARGAVLSEALRQLKQAGQVEKIGVSIYAPGDLEALMVHLSPDLVQAPFNVFDRRLYESGWLQRLHDAGTEVHVRSVFLQGVLLMDAHDRPPRFAAWNPLWERWSAWLQDNALPAVDACLGFVSAFPQVQRVVVGVDSLEHFQGLVRAATSRVSQPPADLHCSDLSLIDPSRWGKA